MQPTDDSALLRDYCENQSHEAFAELVTRYINLVYSVAVRHVGNPHHAEEIAQAVFIILARKATSLRHDKALSSWLFQATHLTANNFIRSEMRRHRREQEAYMQSNLNESDAGLWKEIAPLLDTAVARLSEKDRRVIVLRFYEGRNLHEVGAALGANEEAVKKRISRALEKLRKMFTKRGVHSTTVAIAENLSANSIMVAPATLTKAVTTVALTKGVAAPISTLTLIKGALKVMAWTKAKTAIVVGAVVILAAGIMTPIVVHHIRASASDYSSTKELSDTDSANYQKLTGMTPEQAARAMFEAWGSENWQKLAAFWPPGDSSLNDYKNYGGLQIVSLGKPFKGKFRDSGREYRGVYVPYEIRLKNGYVKKWHLAIRCDNPQHHWYFDGGM